MGKQIEKKKKISRKQQREKHKNSIKCLIQKAYSTDQPPIDLPSFIISPDQQEQYIAFEQVFQKHKLLAQRRQRQILDCNVQLQKQAEIYYTKQNKISKRKRKAEQWRLVAKLKENVKRLDLVQSWDVTSYDPMLLLHFKSTKNTVQIPRHWSNKTRYLQTKRGILKPAFKLPDYIETTGISKLRDPFLQSGTGMVKQKLRQRMKPRLGKIDIDYQVLHQAFFKYQTKPPLTSFGQVYYQGKEHETGSAKFRAGLLTLQLRNALSLGEFDAPPWLLNMQRYGPPPSYPSLRILGSYTLLNQSNHFRFVSKAQVEEQSRKIGRPGLYATMHSLENQSSIKGPLKIWGIYQNQAEQIPLPEEN